MRAADNLIARPGQIPVWLTRQWPARMRTMVDIALHAIAAPNDKAQEQSLILAKHKPLGPGVGQIAEGAEHCARFWLGRIQASPPRLIFQGKISRRSNRPARA